MSDPASFTAAEAARWTRVESRGPRQGWAAARRIAARDVARVETVAPTLAVGRARASHQRRRVGFGIGVPDLHRIKIST